MAKFSKMSRKAASYWRPLELLLTTLHATFPYPFTFLAKLGVAIGFGFAGFFRIGTSLRAGGQGGGGWFRRLRFRGGLGFEATKCGEAFRHGGIRDGNSLAFGAAFVGVFGGR
jgi:hypothetical protein